MRIVVIGTGYVGLPTAVCFVEMGNSVCCLDIDEDKIRRLRNGEVPIFEPGLDSLLKSSLKSGRLTFESSYDRLPASQMFMICVGTPPHDDGNVDLSQVFSAAESLSAVINPESLVVVKSTVPPGTTKNVASIIRQGFQRRGIGATPRVAFCPEFLKQGAAVADTMKPDRVVIGVDKAEDALELQSLYSLFTRNHDRTLIMDSVSAELTKYASNAMLATRISFMNELSLISDSVGGDIEAVRRGIGADSRIGASFLYAGVGYGGSCFPKDVKGLISVARARSLDPLLLTAVDRRNSHQKQVMGDRVSRALGDDLSGKRVAIWGLSFKPETDDLREAPSLVIVRNLLAKNAKVSVSDPIVGEEFLRRFTESQIANLCFYPDHYDATNDADALILVTEWKPYRSPDFDELKRRMRGNHLFDGRNQWDPATAQRAGFVYCGIGRC